MHVTRPFICTVLYFFVKEREGIVLLRICGARLPVYNEYTRSQAPHILTTCRHIK